MIVWIRNTEELMNNIISFVAHGLLLRERVDPPPRRKVNEFIVEPKH